MKPVDQVTADIQEYLYDHMTKYKHVFFVEPSAQPFGGNYDLYFNIEYPLPGKAYSFQIYKEALHDMVKRGLCIQESKKYYKFNIAELFYSKE